MALSAYELLCCEARAESGLLHAHEDLIMLDDDRVLQNLLVTEENYIPPCSYFKCIQRDIKPHMRRIVADWMLEVCEEQACSEEVFVLAMNILDRFLCLVEIQKSQLQLLGAVCLFLASKLKETRPLSARALVIYTANSITLNQLLDWEILVLARLKWDLNAITAHDFVDYMVRKLPSSDAPDTPMVKRHARIFINLCATEVAFTQIPPSVVAAACVGAAIHGLSGAASLPAGASTHFAHILNRLHLITSIEADVIRSCVEQIEGMVSRRLPGPGSAGGNGDRGLGVSSVSPSSPHLKTSPHANNSLTPEDVWNVHF